MNVYYGPLLDGIHSFAVAAKNQKDACELLGVSVGYLRKHGGRKVKVIDPLHSLANLTPRMVLMKKVEFGKETPWLPEEVK